MRRLLLLWHTLKWLRPVQFYGRLWFRLARPRPELTAPPAVRLGARNWIRCTHEPSMTGARTFRFLEVEHELVTAGDWNRADWPKLWLYNVHYFDDLTADDAPKRSDWHRALVAGWIAENPPGLGVGWEPYPTSLRIANWVKWALGGETLDPLATHSLAVQARYLCRRLEVHLLGNHLWANAKALVFVGVFFEGEEADAWRSKGMAILKKELNEQILGDGGHFERSPMYHCIVLQDLLDLLQLASVYQQVFSETALAHWRCTAGKMLRWLRVMSHPDGGISFFNDAALGVAPNLQVLERYARNLGVGWDETPLNRLELLPSSGYARLEAGNAVLIADVGPVGPDYLPGHAHADTLSFELSVHGRRVLVNGGTSTYEAGSLRQQQRGTAMHNTVQVDGQDSSEVWSSFRVARRARPGAVSSRDDGEDLQLMASHDGYRRLPGRVIHHRSWRLGNGWLEVNDRLEGSYSIAYARFRFAPGAMSIDWSAAGAAAWLEPGIWCPRFGMEQPCQVLKTTIVDGRATMKFSWT